MPLLSTDYKKVHIPVMVDEVLQIFNIKDDGIYVDATVGCGGHSLEILKRLGEIGKLIGFDRDPDAIEHAREVLKDSRVILVKARFSQIKKELYEIGIKEIDGILFDFGVSMLQLKDFSRGFSFHSNERLDMRMDQTTELTAWDVVNRYSEQRLLQIFRDYGDEPFAKKIAREIVKQRGKKAIDTCKELADLISKIVPRRGRTHPATQTFQAIRIEVNREFDELKEGLKQALNLLKNGGRICLISYHSGEDRIVKNFLREEEKKGTIKILTKKPIFPSLDEVSKNPASRSARLRGGEKLCTE
ncbi:16S rRNA (cytosine(1402)-N(4))-methyltransferase RsmH [Thermodesulfovibrio hydrogeniphilus]